MKHGIKKLKSRSGESIAETLLAVLVAALALTMLAGMITAAVSMVKKSEEKMDDYYRESWKLEQIEEAGDDADTLNLSITGTDGITISGIKVYSAKNETFQKTPVTAYRPANGTGGGP